MGCPPNLSRPSGPSPHPTGVTPIAVPPFHPHPSSFRMRPPPHRGPLGSMVGIYETAIEALAWRFWAGHLIKPKYVASSATVRNAEDQVASLYERRLAQFPPPGSRLDVKASLPSVVSHILWRPRFRVGYTWRYALLAEVHRPRSLESGRVFSRPLEERRLGGISPNLLDPFWTLVGYFNAIRELAGVVALVRTGRTSENVSRSCLRCLACWMKMSRLNCRAEPTR